MPLATVRGAAIHYLVVGEKGPWVSLSPGGRRPLEAVRSLGEGQLAEVFLDFLNRADATTRRTAA